MDKIHFENSNYYKRKHELFKRYRRSNSYQDIEDYKMHNNRTRQTVRKAQANLRIISEFIQLQRTQMAKCRY